MLTHWGRLDFPHTSNSGYWADDYSKDVGGQEGAEGMAVRAGMRLRAVRMAALCCG
jgi:hypothetical protein